MSREFNLDTTERRTDKQLFPHTPPSPPCMFPPRRPFWRQERKREIHHTLQGSNRPCSPTKRRNPGPAWAILHSHKATLCPTGVADEESLGQEGVWHVHECYMLRDLGPKLRNKWDKRLKGVLFKQRLRICQESEYADSRGMRTGDHCRSTWSVDYAYAFTQHLARV